MEHFGVLGKKRGAAGDEKRGALAMAGEGDIEVLFSSRHGLSPAWRVGAFRKGGQAQCRAAEDTVRELAETVMFGRCAIPAHCLV